MPIDPHYDLHVFVCTNKKDKNVPCCADKNSMELRDKLKARSNELCSSPEIKSVRVNASGCLGHCERGVAIVAYPQGKWILEAHNLSPEEIIDRLKR